MSKENIGSRIRKLREAQELSLEQLAQRSSLAGEFIAALEELQYAMEGVSDVQVVGVPSRKYGEEVGAFIIPKPGLTLSPEEVRDFCRGKIARYNIPKYIAFVDDYPLTASGKIQKFKLRETASRLFPEAMR